MAAADGNDKHFMPGAPGFLALLVAIGERPGLTAEELQRELERQFGRPVAPAELRRALRRLVRMGFLAGGADATGLVLLNFEGLDDSEPGPGEDEGAGLR